VSLSSLRDINTDMTEITKQVTAFMCKCCNVSSMATMAEARVKSGFQ